MGKDTITLELSMDDLNIILKALGNLPFNEVYEIIGQIHAQANQQLFGIESIQSSLTENE
jgi:hypothetical protein